MSRRYAELVEALRNEVVDLATARALLLDPDWCCQTKSGGPRFAAPLPFISGCSHRSSVKT
jgi:hypothetical protein